MPIRPENKNRYPADWRAISDNIRFGRAGGRCECDGRCGARSHHPDTGRCRAVHQSLHPVTRSLVILTTAHLDHQPENCDPTNLMAMCQACHLAYDHDHHAQSRRQSAVIDGQRDLFASAPTAGPEPGEEPEARSPKSVTREFVNDHKAAGSDTIAALIEHAYLGESPC